MSSRLCKNTESVASSFKVRSVIQERKTMVLSDASGRMRPLVLDQAEADNWTGSSDRNSEVRCQL